jgi:hypothetical protein
MGIVMFPSLISRRFDFTRGICLFVTFLSRPRPDSRQILIESGGAYGARTRNLRRDRAAL